MKLYTSLSQLNQPPHFGRVNAQPVHVRPGVEALAKQAHQAAQFERITQTQKHGGRAVVGA